MILRAFLSFFLVLLLVCCTDNRASFFIQDMKIPTDECEFPSERDAAYKTGGTWDISLSTSYTATPLLINEMECSQKLNPVTAQTNTIQIWGAYVAVLSTDETELTGEYFIHSPATVYSQGGSTTVGFTAVSLDIYNTLAGQPGSPLAPMDELCLTPTASGIILRIRMSGITSGGKEVDTPYFYFPVTVCCGCLIWFPPDTYNPATELHECLVEEGTSETEPPCLPGQDQFLDCRVCAGNNPFACAPTHDLFGNPWYSI